MCHLSVAKAIKNSKRGQKSSKKVLIDKPQGGGHYVRIAWKSMEVTNLQMTQGVIFFISLYPCKIIRLTSMHFLKLHIQEYCLAKCQWSSTAGGCLMRNVSWSNTKKVVEIWLAKG